MENLLMGKWIIKPYMGKWCGRKKADTIRKMLLNTPAPDRTALKKEASEFLDYMKKKGLAHTADKV